MSTESKEVEVLVEHPMEDVLNIESGTTPLTKVERTSELVPTEEFDDKDTEIEEQFQEVYDSAMGAFEGQMDEAELVEGKYKARNGEVAVQFLNAALAAAKEKGGMKQHKDKLSVAKGKITAGGGGTNGKLIIADRNELLKEIMGGKVGYEPEDIPIDAEFESTD